MLTTGAGHIKIEEVWGRGVMDARTLLGMLQTLNPNSHKENSFFS